MLKQNQQHTQKHIKTLTIVEISIADGFVMTIGKTEKRNKTVQVQLESLSVPLKMRD